MGMIVKIPPTLEGIDISRGTRIFLRPPNFYIAFIAACVATLDALRKND